MAKMDFSRRGFLTAGAVSASGLALSGCDALDGFLRGGSRVRDVLASAESLTYRVQRMLVGDALAQEFDEADIRQPQRPNGSTSPQDEEYLALARQGFQNYRLPVTGLVDRPLSLSLENIRAMASRTQITRHDCVEGWSCIAKWTGVPLVTILDEAGLKPEARYVVFQCFDIMEQGLSGVVKYYESIDMIDARHPQTILAYGLNSGVLPVENGAPLRLRVERQLGYKMAKYVRSIEVTDTLQPFGTGKGGFWEDRGYEWYAGI